MKNTQFIIILLILIAVLLIIRIIKIKYYPSNINPGIPNPSPPKHLIGGCGGTRFGCCPSSNIACSDINCSNCESNLGKEKK